MMRFFTLCWLLCFVTMAASAQHADLHGQVTDPNGALVPGATVTAAGPGGKIATATADVAGRYDFRNLDSGSYSVTASAPGLNSAHPEQISLHGIQTLNLRLALASVTQNVTVDSGQGELNTEAGTNANGVTIKGDALDALSDDPDELQADLQALAGPSAGPSGGSMYIDGFSSGELPPKQSIREIRINQNPFSPEYDKLGYGRIDIFTKPGSDRYRATIDYNLGSAIWNTRNPYSSEKAPFLLNEFEGTGGGPINRHASFILDAQRNMVDNGSIVNAVVVDPSTFTIAPYNGNVVIPQRLTRATPRMDYQIGDRNTLTVRYGWTHADIPNAGIGAFNLSGSGYHTQYTNQTAQAGDTTVFGAAINELRFQYYRAAIHQQAYDSNPAVNVLGSFNNGGAILGNSNDVQNNYELQDYISLIHKTHSIRFGVRLREGMEDSTAPQNFNGTFVFGGVAEGPALNANNQPEYDSSGNPVLIPISSIEQYRRTLLFESLGDSPSVIRSLGGGASQFSISTGNPETAVSQFDAALFAGDDWHLTSNLNLSFGLRYELQTNIQDWHDFAPRIAAAWAPKRSRGKMVIRVGSGIFYDRFLLASTLAAERYNGLVQQQYTITNPDFYASIPSSGTLADNPSGQTIETVSPTARAEYLIQSSFAVERQLPRHSSVALTYTNAHGLHMFRSADINAPYPGTWNPQQAGSGVYPLGYPGPRFVMESSGLYNQNQLIVNGKTNAGSAVSLFGFYVWNRASSNTDGITTSSANPYCQAGEYSRAATDIRQRASFGGSVNFRWAIRVSPFVVAQSGAPFDITTGADQFGTTILNARPGIATDPTKPGLIQTSYGLLDPSPVAGEQILQRNAGRSPAQINFNLRLAKSIGFGTRASAKHEDSGASVTDTARAATGKGLGALIGTPSTERRYNLTISLSARNVLNYVNPGPITGNITSPLFGKSNQIAGVPNGEGFYETANNRKLEFQVRLAF
jgi:hypothetical protein